MKKNNNSAFRPVAFQATRPPMPRRPYPYATYKHNMERQIPMVGDVIHEWRIEKNVSRSTLAYTATKIAEIAKIPVKLTYQDIVNYESRRCQPKIDKLTILAYAMGMMPEQLTGYNPRVIKGLLDVSNDFGNENPAA